MNWSIVIPIKAAGWRKTRLAGILSPAERTRLTDTWLSRLVEVAVPLGRILLLSPQPIEHRGAIWVQDVDGDINANLGILYDGFRRPQFAIVNPDLPAVETDDIRALLMAAEETGCAIAPDRHGSGTNALALADGRPFIFAFGPGSLARHYTTARCQMAIVRRAGLALDIDTPDDLNRLDQPASLNTTIT